MQVIGLDERSGAIPAPDQLTADDHRLTTDDPVAGDLYALVVFLHKNCNADLFAAIAELGLSLTQVKMLHYLEEADRDLTLKELAELVPVSLPAASRSVDELVQRGLVLRNEDAADRRMKRVRITPAGRSATVTLNAARLTGLEQFSADLTAAERTAVTAALALLLDRNEIAACRPPGASQ